MNKFLAQAVPALDFNAIQNAGNPTAHFGVGTSIGQIISALLPYIFTVAGMLLLVYLIFGGLQMMTSQGEPKATAAARQHITNALIGFAIIFFAYWAVQLVGRILGLTGANGITQIFGGK